MGQRDFWAFAKIHDRAGGFLIWVPLPLPTRLSLYFRHWFPHSLQETSGRRKGPQSRRLCGNQWLWWLGGKESTHQCRRHRFHPWVWKISWRAEQPTPVFLPGEFHGQRAWWATVHGLQRFGHDWAANTFTFFS